MVAIAFIAIFDVHNGFSFKETALKSLVMNIYSFIASYSLIQRSFCCFLKTITAVQRFIYFKLLVRFKKWDAVASIEVPFFEMMILICVLFVTISLEAVFFSFHNMLSSNWFHNGIVEKIGVASKWGKEGICCRWFQHCSNSHRSLWCRPRFWEEWVSCWPI